MKRFVLTACLVMAAASLPLVAVAQDIEGPGPDEVTLGELSIRFVNAEFPSIRVDGEGWENTEYSADGRTVAIQMLDRTATHVVSLISNSPKAGDTELTVKPEDWKLVKLNKLDRAWRCEKTVTFPKKAPPPKVEEPPAEEPVGEPGEVSPEQVP